MYRVEIHREAVKEIRSLPSNIKDKVIEALKTLQRTPYPHREYDLKKLSGLKDVYRIRIGKYRISYYVNDVEKRIIVLEVRDRGSAYSTLRRRLKKR